VSTRLPVLTTARLVVRPFALDDLDACHRTLDGDAGGGRSRDQRAAWLDWTVRSYDELAALYQPPYGDRAVALRDGGELVGAVGLVPVLAPLDRLRAYGGDVAADHLRPEVGLFWATAAAHRRRGYAAEAAAALIDHAFGAVGLRRIVALTERDNLASQAVMRRLGMAIEDNPRPDPPWFQVAGVLDTRP